MTSLATAARRHALSRPVVREAFTELVATAFLLIAVVGSGIMAERLCGDNVGLALLANAIATGGALTALILAFGPQSGAHMNPVVTLAAAAMDGSARICRLGGRSGTVSRVLVQNAATACRFPQTYRRRGFASEAIPRGARRL